MARAWILASRPQGMPTLDNFKLVETPAPPLKSGEVRVQTLYLSVDPYMRGRMRNVRSYTPPLEIGEILEGGVVGKITESKDPAFHPGEVVFARLRWQDFTVAEGKTLRKIESEPALLPAHLGVLGMPGLTAYFALLEVGQPKSGETVLVSAAAGAVGSIVGQIAKIKGCRAVGLAGTNEKVDWIKNKLGFDGGINYKESASLRGDIKKTCPNGIDVYFDNVGGPISDAAISLIHMRARIIICGQISLYNNEQPEMGPRNLSYLLVNRARMEGFLIRDYESKYAEGLAQLTAWVKEGKIQHRESIVQGLENAPRAFLGLFTGENIGKQVVQVSDLN